MTNLLNNFWVLFASMLIFLMTIAVGFLEIGELGLRMKRSLYKSILITGISFIVMAFIGFNTAFAPTIGGIIGNPFYKPGFFLGSLVSPEAIFSTQWWSTLPAYFGTGLWPISYFMLEATSSSVTLALVSVVLLRKVKLSAFTAFSVVYFIIIFNLPAAWIWNPTGWLYILGMRDFAGGLVVHGAAGIAGLAILVRIWQEEKARGIEKSPSESIRINPGFLTLAILLLIVGWVGFDPGNVLAFNYDTLIVVFVVLISGFAGMISVLGTSYLVSKDTGGILNAVNGIIMGLIVITPLAGFVSPLSAFILGIISGPLYVSASAFFGRRKWLSDPVGLLPEHMTGGIFGIIMIGFFTQHSYAVLSGNSVLPNGLFFGGGFAAIHALGVEILGIVAVVAVVFALSYITIFFISKAMHGILEDYSQFNHVRHSSSAIHSTHQAGSKK